MRPRSPTAMFLALVPFGLMAGLGWSLAWTSGETAVFLLGFTLILTPAIWTAILLGLQRRHWVFALWAAAAWAAIVPGSFEAEDHFVDLRFEMQRELLDEEVASIERVALRTPAFVETPTELSPSGEAWTVRAAGSTQIWFLRRRDRALVHSSAPGAAFGPYVAASCRRLDASWFDCEI